MLNTIIIMGCIVADPELKTTQSGVSVTTFRIACDRDRTVEGGQKADFVDCVAWRKTAEFISKYFQKGKPILIQGRLQIRPYETKDGQKRSATEILVESANFCGGDRVNNSAPAAPAPDLDAPIPAVTPEMSPLDIPDGELPF